MSGPAFFESLAVFPSSSRFVVDVNLGNNSVEIAQNQIQAAIKYLGWDRIYSLERKVHDCCLEKSSLLNTYIVGNEPDHYAGGSRPSGWSSQDYTDQFLVSCIPRREEV